MSDVMTVGQLIEALKKFDADLLLVTGGFDEAGIDHVECVEVINIRLNANSGSHIGPHELNPTGVPAVWIDAGKAH